ncbi:hypothetical protein BKA83DRAFT_2061792 [Pisolithus microcarpus]|nr:hypothetical protein BKA83DRAFT_2061792 [Pisolithus microcarpus]
MRAEIHRRLERYRTSRSYIAHQGRTRMLERDDPEATLFVTMLPLLPLTLGTDILGCVATNLGYECDSTSTRTLEGTKRLQLTFTHAPLDSGRRDSSTLPQIRRQAPTFGYLNRFNFEDVRVLAEESTSCMLYHRQRLVKIASLAILTLPCRPVTATVSTR